eukprot:CAMPEP_0115049286 /NCGR_PEP_ID=MMETSP0227-20121206/1098_1 /TAXON_ID=89957 /ORGANISM="Polarella glacialis, Strain CCMP 1383" /LENGTH=407 /DNA_ID=CAMNT_0002432921 /DNA_START=97 /DNA_END=1320 /DNA_ORIENTATION=+
MATFVVPAAHGPHMAFSSGLPGASLRFGGFESGTSRPSAPSRASGPPGIQRSKASSGLPLPVGVALAAAAVAMCRLAHRQSHRRRAAGFPLRAAKADSLTEEQKMDIVMRDEMVKVTIAASTPVPQTFQQGINWACTAALAANDAGKQVQSMYFDAGGGDNQVTGEIGGVLQFSEQLVRTLASCGKLPDGEGEIAEDGEVRVMFSDLGAKSMVANRWGVLPENVVLDFFPPVLRNVPLKMEEQMKIAAMMNAAVLVVVTPGQAELPAVLAVYEALKDTGRKVPMVFVNARLVQDVGAAAGALLNNYRNMERLLLPVFHLEQYEPPEDKELIPLNPAVITRVWPRPFSVWEDNPDDPDSIEGYFLLDVNDVRAPNGDDMVAFLTMSRKATKDLRNRERETREKGGRLI